MERTPTTPRRRRQRVGAPAASRGLTSNWLARSALQRQRIGQWFAWTRQSKLHMSLRALRDAAAADGIELSVGAIRRLEALADLREAAERKRIALDDILWLAAYSGQTLADLERFISSGDWSQVGNLRDAAPSIDSQADRVRQRFLSLTTARQEHVVAFIEHERYLDDYDIQTQVEAAIGDDRADDVDLPDPAERSAMTAETVGVIAQAQASMRAAQQEHEQQRQQQQDTGRRKRVKRGDGADHAERERRHHSSS